MFIAVEVTIVALLAASALVLPLAGGRVEAYTICGIGIGHIIGAFVSVPIWTRAGARVLGYALLFLSAMCSVAGLWRLTEARIAAVADQQHHAPAEAAPPDGV